MTAMLLDCPSDGIVPIEPPIVLTDDANGRIELVNSRFPCPLCHQTAPLVDTVLRPEGQVEFRLTEDQARRLFEAMRWAERVVEDGSVSPEEVAARLGNTLKEIAPGILGVVSKALSERGAALAAWISVLVAVIALLVSAQGAGDERSGITVDDVERIYELFHDGRGDSPTPSGPRHPMPQVEPRSPGATQDP